MLHIELLGELRITVDGERRENPTSVKARLLLARLSASRGNLTREAVAEEFWGDAELRSARGSLSTELKNLRRTLGAGAELLVATRHQVGLPRHEDLWIDLRDFVEHIAAERYEDALALWRGDFLQETSGAWADAERIGYRRRAARAFAALADARESAGDLLGAADLARQQRDLIPDEIDPWKRLLRILEADWGIVNGPDGNLWFTKSATNKIAKMNTKSEVLAEYALPAGSVPMGITVGSDHNLWFVDYGTNCITKMTTAGVKTEYCSLAAGSHPYDIVSGSDGNLWFTENGTSRIGKITVGGGVTEYSLPSGSLPRGITPGATGTLWYTDYGTQKLGEISTTGSILGEHYTGVGSNPFNVVYGSDGNVWFTEYGPNIIARYTPTWTEGGAVAPAAGATIEYGLSTGTGPKLTRAEVEKWGQKDYPAEATAIFPPDEPQAWPATKYDKATFYYLDAKGFTVNIASPNGGIVTSEFDANGNPTRTLSADDRVSAIEESKFIASTENLYTVNTYSPDGTELLETLGPEHHVKLPNGSDVLARKKVKYTYDEGAPTEHGPYRLVTKTKEAALVAGKEEDIRTVTNQYSGQSGLGWELHEPTSTVTDSEGLKLTHKTTYDPSTGQASETQMPAAEPEAATLTPVYSTSFGEYGSGNGQLKAPKELALDGKGHLYVADEDNSRIEEFTEAGSWVKNVGSLGTGNGQVKEPRGVALDSKGNIWVADTANNRIEEFTEAGAFTRVTGTKGASNGQFKEPKGIAVDSHNNVWVSDTGNSRIQEFNEKGEFIRAVGKLGVGLGEYKEPRGITVAPDGTIWVADAGNNRVQQLNETGTGLHAYGTEGAGNGQFKEPKSIGVDAHGNVWVSDSENNRVEELNAKGEYQTQFGAPGKGEGQFEEPFGIRPDSHGNIYVADASKNRIQKWSLATNGNSEAHDSRITYYTASTEAGVLTCQKHPEWAGLACQTEPAHQPGTLGLPNLPVTTFTYNTLDETETTTSVNGPSIRTETNTYDAGGRPTTKEIGSTNGTSLPALTFEYNLGTGLPLETISGHGPGEETNVRTMYNKLGQLIAYYDADGNTAIYEYEPSGDERLTKISDNKGSQQYTYDPTTGFEKEIVDSAAGHFTAAYDPEGNISSETYPNGMEVTHRYNALSEPTSLQYQKTTHCTEEPEGQCILFKDAAVPTIHGQWASQSSSLSSETYRWDSTGRLVETQTTPTGKGCTAHLYGYDADGNRTSLTTRAPNAEGKCPSEGGIVETHAYDTADRLTDPGLTYEPFGEISGLSAADAGGSVLKAGYYADGQAACLEQNGQTIGYKLDPARRTRETISTGHATSDVIEHYDGPGPLPAWSSYTSGETERNIGAFGLSNAAIQYNNEKPLLQIANLHGDIVGTIADSETETHLQSSVDISEYGVPTTSNPPKYSWLGAGELPTELVSGVLDMGARAYVPQLGRFLQPDPSPGGSADAYAYTYGNPLNESDPSGAWSLQVTSGGMSAVGTGEGVRIPTGLAAGAIEPAPVNQEIEKAFEENPPWDQLTAGGEEYEWEWVEEEDYVATDDDELSSVSEPALLYQSLEDPSTQAEDGESVGDHRLEVSGDGCGDGGYCKGHWVLKSTRYHRHGEPIGESLGTPCNASFHLSLAAAAAGPLGVVGGLVISGVCGKL